jgi:hypothetical protein
MSVNLARVTVSFYCRQLRETKLKKKRGKSQRKEMFVGFQVFTSTTWTGSLPVGRCGRETAGGFSSDPGFQPCNPIGAI